MSNQPLEPTEAPVTDAAPNTTSNSARNAIKHGACAVSTLILPNESYEDYLAVEERNFTGYGYCSGGKNCLQMAAELVRAISRAEWVYLRSERNYLEAEARLMSQVPDILDWTEEHHRTLARFQRYRTANLNVLLKTRKAMEEFRKARAREMADAIKNTQSNQKLAMTRERLEILREKNRETDFDEEIEKMRDKAIRLGFLNPDGTPGPRKY